MLLEMAAAADQESSATYMLVVDDHTVLTSGTVGTHMLLDTPVTTPPAQNATTATARGKSLHQNKHQSLRPSRRQQDKETPAGAQQSDQKVKGVQLTVNGQTAASRPCSHKR